MLGWASGSTESVGSWSVLVSMLMVAGASGKLLLCISDILDDVFYCFVMMVSITYITNLTREMLAFLLILRPSASYSGIHLGRVVGSPHGVLVRAVGPDHRSR